MVALALPVIVFNQKLADEVLIESLVLDLEGKGVKSHFLPVLGV